MLILVNYLEVQVRLLKGEAGSPYSFVPNYTKNFLKKPSNSFNYYEYLKSPLNLRNLDNKVSSHCMKSVQMRSYFWFVFSCIRIEYGAEITPYLDTFHAVSLHPPSLYLRVRLLAINT